SARPLDARPRRARGASSHPRCLPQHQGRRALRIRRSSHGTRRSQGWGGRLPRKGCSPAAARAGADRDHAAVAGGLQRRLMVVRDASDDPLAGLSADELLRVLGHEIGNLVTIVSGYGQMLRDHWEFLADERRLDIVARMNRQIDQLRVLIDNFQHLRSLPVSTPGLTVTGPATDLSDMLNALTDDLAPLADEHPLQVPIEAGLPPVIADRASVQHVLMNLIVNATKFSPPEAAIDVDVQRDGDAVRVSVTDRGVGIPADKRDRIFEKFVRLQDGGVGVGLGLFICRALVESMGGRIWAGEGPDGGARMSFTLPIAN